MSQLQFKSTDTIDWKEAFSNGSDGDAAVTTIHGSTGYGTATFTGTSGNTYGTFLDRNYFNGSNGGRIGDIVLIHQTQGTGAGNWQLNKIVSRIGSTLNLKYALTHNYYTGCQIVSAGSYKNLTLSGSPSSWNGTWGGIVFAIAKTKITVSGTLSSTGRGFRGPTDLSYSMNGESAEKAWTGEGYTRNSIESISANASGGAGGNGGDGGGGGGGGGHAATGTVGQAGQGSTAPGGSSCGNTALTVMVSGGGGGSGKGESSANCVSDRTYYAGLGGSSGGIVLLMSKKIVVSGSIACSGAAGANAYGACEEGAGGGGGGSGGSILIKAEEATLGTTKVVGTGGTGGAGNGGSHANGGAGSTGRIHLDYSKSYSGTTSPTINITKDLTIKGKNGGGFFAFM